MRIMLDTTYILPFVGVDVKGGATFENMLELLDSGHHFCASELSLFETLGKARALIRDERSRRRVEEGLKAVLGSDRLELLPVMDEETVPLILDLLFEGRKDLPDAVIAASAMMHADILLTESKDIPALLNQRGFRYTNLREFLS